MADKPYIVAEARRLFKANKDINDAEEVDKCIKECEERIELALHYKIPRPKLHYAIKLSPERLRHASCSIPCYVIMFSHHYIVYLLLYSMDWE